MKELSVIQVLRALAASTMFVEDYSGFDFEHVGGNLYRFWSFSGYGYCYRREDQRFKYSTAVLEEDVMGLQ